MNVVVQGIILLVVGMGILFAAMALLILAMVVLERLFRVQDLIPDEQEPEEIEAVGGLARDTEDEELVAAIAVALAHLRSLEIGQSGLGTALEAGRGLWWTMGRAQQRSAPLSGTVHTPQGRR